MKPLDQARLYGILDLGYLSVEDLESTTTAMLNGGIDVLQLRAKSESPGRIASLARQVLPHTREAGVPLIINDHPEIAVEVEADGIHVGQDDRSVEEVRDLVGPDMLVGLSTHSLEQARAANRERVNYIGFGPLFATPTKPDYSPIGVGDIAQVHRELDLPIFCIGGIKQDNLPSVLGAGARRVVIVSGILQAHSISDYVRDTQTLLRTTPADLQTRQTELKAG